MMDDGLKVKKINEVYKNLNCDIILNIDCECSAVGLVNGTLSL